MLVHFVLSIYNANFNLNVTSAEVERRLSIVLVYDNSLSFFNFFLSSKCIVNKLMVSVSTSVLRFLEQKETPLRLLGFDFSFISIHVCCNPSR